MIEEGTAEPRAESWSDITPSIWQVRSAQKSIRHVVAALRRLRAHAPAPEAVEHVRLASLKAARLLRLKRAPELAVCIHVLCDLRSQGWRLRCTRSGLSAMVPSNGLDAQTEKARVRAAHEVERDQQLRQPSVKRFVLEMEKMRLHKGEWRSIFSVMRDGAELSRELAGATSAETSNALGLLRRAIDPYVQPAVAGKYCKFTGLDLLEIWRYFRHTWTTTYQSTPGRKLFFLIRDRAAPCHPIIGIAALGSPIVQLSVRDRWIGWSSDALIQQMASESPDAWVPWIEGSLDGLVSSIYVADFIADGVIRRSDLKSPRRQTLDRLTALASAERARHRLYPQPEQHKKGSGPLQQWEREAKTHLFRSKRATALRELLRARLDVNEAGLKRVTPAQWPEALRADNLHRAVATIARHVKASHVGIDVMDMTVCGAIAPYNHLLGGKLVALLMASSEVRKEYQRRYQRTPSIIASSMAARPMVRRPRLVLLGTTSLYSVAPSQYNRLRMPVGVNGDELTYAPLGKTVGYGSYHFSRETIEAFELLLARLERGRPVNSIFGEGVNPKLRKVRAALDAVGLPANLLLQHGSPRLVYGVALARNFREVLLGKASRPDYLLPSGARATVAIVDHWRKRWLSNRIKSDGVLPAMAKHTLAVPVSHGARVELPSAQVAMTADGGEQLWDGASDSEELDQLEQSTATMRESASRSKRSM